MTIPTMTVLSAISQLNVKVRKCNAIPHRVELAAVFIGIHIVNKLFKPDRSKDHYKQPYRTGDGQYRYQPEDNKG